MRSPTSIYHVLQLARSELRGILAPDLDWLESQTSGPETTGLYGVWAEGKLDGWVGRDGPLVQERLGLRRVKILETVPHAFCLCALLPFACNKRADQIAKDHSVLVAEIVAGWMDPSRQSKPRGSAEPTDESLASLAPM